MAANDKSDSATTVSESHSLRCELAAEVLRSSGSLRLRVTGWSMLPTIWPGDTLIIEHTEGAIIPGDIVLFQRERRFFAHRVVEAGQGSPTVTRGDSMPKCDGPVPARDLLGKVRFIVRNGKLIEPAKSLGLPERAAAALLQRSERAARVAVTLHNLRQPATISGTENS
jgi:hypothetical protein